MSIETYEYAIDSVRTYYQNVLKKNNPNLMRAISNYKIDSTFNVEINWDHKLNIEELKSYFKDSVPEFVYYDSDIEGILETDPDLSVMELSSRGIYKVNVWHLLLGPDLYKKVKS